jgi:S-adenosylmethionine:tRNA ribosyltransferase-isomerase
LGTFADLGRHLPVGSVLVFNRTKVIPARFRVTKPTGGQAELLYIGQADGLVSVMSNRRLTSGSRLRLADRHSFTVVDRPGKLYRLRPEFSASRLMTLLEKYGRAPLPPYIKESPLTEAERRRQYQTVFAKERGSVAAPTASLHFSRRLLADLRRQGIEQRYITLHVGLGTFAPVTEQQLASGRLHVEEYRIAPRTAAWLNQAKRAGRPIVAVGTTVCRALESAADEYGQLQRLAGQTDLFIREGYRFRFIDGLITNFHVPKSSLTMLVAALIGRDRLLETYAQAIQEQFRLFSFGDGMLVV